MNIIKGASANPARFSFRFIHISFFSLNEKENQVQTERKNVQDHVSASSQDSTIDVECCQGEYKTTLKVHT